MKLPVKRTAGETLRERLTEDVYRYLLPARYLLRNEAGKIVETPEALFRRVAENIARPEAEYGHDVQAAADAFNDMMTRLEFLPNSPTLMNAGAPLQQLAACFVLSPEDSLPSIFETLHRAAVIFQSGGGVGYAFSKLRPQGDRVRSTGGVASGPVSFMHIYDQMCATLKQGGKRRGAQMGILRVDHPDVGRFIVAKRREGGLANFNLSVAVTEAFIEAVDNDAVFPFINPRTGAPFEVVRQTAQFYGTDYEGAGPRVVEENFWRDYAAGIEGIDLFRGRTDLTVGAPMRLPARFLWHVLVDSAWRNGEPGLFMIDAANRAHSFDVTTHPAHHLAATNPCGEQPLENYEACVLGHVNLSLMVAGQAPDWRVFRAQHDGPLAEAVAAFLARAVDWGRLERVTRLGTRFLDNAVTMSAFPFEEITEKVQGLRAIGLGVMGFAEMLIQLGVIYGSDASFEVARRLMAFINRTTKQASHDLARERGAFRGWADSKYARPTAYPDWFRRHTGLDPAAWKDGFPLRNHHTTTLAPTGTTSLIANTSGGCEPLFNVVYFRHLAEDLEGVERLVVFDDYFLRVLEANGLDVEAVKREARRLMEAGAFAGPASLSLPERLVELFVTAEQVPAEGHVRMQAAFQEHVDSAISKTINFSPQATRDDVAEAFRLAIRLRCKGLTIYRVGSRAQQVLSTR